MAGPQEPTSIPFPFPSFPGLLQLPPTQLSLPDQPLMSCFYHQDQDPDLLASSLAESTEQTSLNLAQAKEEQGLLNKASAGLG